AEPIMSRERVALIRAVRKNPSCRDTRLVFADWLEEHGEDALAAYIRAECVVLFVKPGSRPWLTAINRLIAITEKADGPLGGWEYATEIKRLARWVAGERAEMDEEDEHYPVIPEPNLLRFEKRRQITLPAAYRAFLLHIANGWSSVGMVNDFIALAITKDHPYLATPFPPSLADADEVIAELGRWARRNYEGMPPRTAEWPDHGCLTVADFGCANWANVVV